MKTQKLPGLQGSGKKVVYAVRELARPCIIPWLKL